MFPNAAQVAAETEKEGKSKWLRDAFASAFGEVKEERKSATEELNEAPVPSPELIASEMEGAEPARDSAAMDFAMQEVAAEIGANIKQTGSNTGDIESLKRNEVVAPLAFSYEPPAEQPFVPPEDAGFVFADHGKIWIATETGTTDATIAVPSGTAIDTDYYFAINLSTGAVTVSAGVAPASTATVENWQIKRDGVQVQGGDIHVTRTA